MSAGALPENAASRYVVGIDLGTTNSAAAFVDTRKAAWQVETFATLQLVAPGVVEARETLPSFHYQQAAGEFPPGSLRLPWSGADPDYTVGLFAREHGAAVPGRLIASAKSWLCHPGVDRLAELLPWHGAPDVDRLSPIEASARYLSHFRSAWNHRFPADPLEQQDVVLGLPASFDEVARELTVRAAARAGLRRVVLIEEPQAAFYDWIHAQGPAWDARVAPGQKILVCDVGGGTSDFTLIRVRQDSSGKIQFHRVAVGEHLILGGDNLDLALAHHLERRLAGDGKLDSRQWAVLVRSCRQAKETLLGENGPPRYVVNVSGAGSRLIGGGLQVEISREEALEVLVEGFLPRVGLSEQPMARRSGFQEFGLPYAADAAITRYLAAFLTAHRNVALDADLPAADRDPARPDVLLFNGGLFASPVLRQRMLDVVGSWFRSPQSPDWQPLVLESDRLDLAVARGAAYYGMVRRGQGVRISAGLARTYYLGVAAAEEAVPDAPPNAVCLLPAGVEEGQTVDLSERRFSLLIHRPVEFPLYVSSTRLADLPGALVTVDREQLTPLPPLRTVLQAGTKTVEAAAVSVGVHARLTEIGTLDLWLAELAGPRSWRLQFDVRSATQTDMAAHQGAAEQQGIADESLLTACRRLIEAAFALPAGKQQTQPEGLVKRLAAELEMPRHEWPPSLLRGMWEVLMEVEPGRKLSPTHEARWLNLLGYCLRPGYGMAIDDWRVAQTWRLLQGRLLHSDPTCRAEWWVLWRRVAGGLAAAQQRALADPLLADLRAARRLLAKGRGPDFKTGAHEAAELWRLLGSLELISPSWKIELGDALLELATREKQTPVRSAGIWAVGRLGARVPLYGPLNTVVPIEQARNWSKRIMQLRGAVDTAPLAVMQLGRKTGDRYRDLADADRGAIVEWLELHQAPAHFIQLVQEGGQLERAEQGLIFGESLPQGLRLA